MRLFLIRHGRASQVAASDAKRPLTDEGIEQAQRMGHILRGYDVRLTKLYCSPRVRAQETADHIGTALSITPEINDACDFDFSVEKAMRLLQGLPDDAQVAFVGHNPSMSEVVHALTGARVELSTGAVACVTGIYLDYPDGAMLKWLLTPRIARSFG